jgi:hypothetical protein
MKGIGNTMSAFDLRLVLKQQQLVLGDSIEAVVSAFHAAGVEVSIKCRLDTETGTWSPVFERHTGAYGAYYLSYELHIKKPLTTEQEASLQEIVSASRHEISGPDVYVLQRLR